MIQKYDYPWILHIEHLRARATLLLRPAQQASGSVAELRDIDGLAHVRVEACHREPGWKVAGKGGDSDGRRGGASIFRLLPHPVEEVGSRTVGKVKVTDDQVRPMHLYMTLRFSDVSRAECSCANKLKGSQEEVKGVAVIPDNQDRAAAQRTNDSVRRGHQSKAYTARFVFVRRKCAAVRKLFRRVNLCSAA